MEATRVLGAVIALTLSAATASACGSSAPRPASNVGPRPAAVSTIEVDEPHGNASLDDLGRVSDLVIKAKVTAITHDVLLGQDRSMSYKQYTLKKTGKKGPSNLDVFVSETIDQVPIAVENRSEIERGQEAIWSLTKLAPEFGRSGYVLSSSSGIFPIVKDNIKVTGKSPAAHEVSRLGPDDVLERLGSN